MQHIAAPIVASSSCAPRPCSGVGCLCVFCWGGLFARFAGLWLAPLVVARAVALLLSVARTRRPLGAPAFGLLPASLASLGSGLCVSPSHWSGLPLRPSAVWSRSLRSRGVVSRLALCFSPSTCCLSLATLAPPPSPVAPCGRSSPWSGSCFYRLGCSVCSPLSFARGLHLPTF